MWSFAFEIAVFTGLAGVIFLALRVLPRISDETFEKEHMRIRTHELTLFMEKADEILKVWFEKFLRKTKIVILKLDNAVTEKISKVTDDRTKEKTSFVIAPPEEEEDEDSRVGITEEGKLVSLGSEIEKLILQEKPMDIPVPKKSSSIRNSGETKRGRKKRAVEGI